MPDLQNSESLDQSTVYQRSVVGSFNVQHDEHNAVDRHRAASIIPISAKIKNSNLAEWLRCATVAINWVGYNC